MEANVPPKRKEPAKSLRIKVISMGNAEVGKERKLLVKNPKVDTSVTGRG